ncbi:hypothetical protein ACFXDH_23645 [Streptomyces sp. NPDC059467]|uniref:hypothetical protein n=1 Tax=Streptomyces sp. NPDC059467 TaxID=3346844 RepID=UPI00367F8FE9
MVSDDQWYVLVEANSGSEWRLKKKQHAGDREAALSKAAEICRTWGPTHSPDDSGRAVFEISETS